MRLNTSMYCVHACIPWGSVKDLSIYIINDKHCPKMQVGMDGERPETQTPRTCFPACQTAKLTAVIGTTFRYPIPNPT